MLSFKKIGLMTALGIFFLAGPGFSEMLSGKVVNYDASTRKLTLSTANPVSGASTNNDIWVASDAQLQGLGGLEEIKGGDTLWVEAETDSEGNLRTRSISRA